MKKNIMIVAIVVVVCMMCASIGMCQSDDTKVKVNNTVCPVTGDAVNMKNPTTMVLNGKIYNLCCPMCEATVRANPEKYSKIAEDQAKSIKA